jgi:type II secretory ATPase GspE/PulE/Tfp pilus assembly ATPase PilB-like protein
MIQDLNATEASPLEQVNRELDDKKARQRAAAAGLSYVDLRHFDVNIDALRLTTKDVAEEAHVIPFDLSGKKIRIAFLGKKSDAAKKLASALEEQDLIVEWVICSMVGLETAMREYDTHLFVRHKIELHTDTEETESQELTTHLQDFSKLEPHLKTLSSGELLNEIELLAVSAQASDVHFQPGEKEMVVRVRVDGVLHDVLKIPIKIAGQLVTRIKYEAGMRANITESPQDGAITFEVNGRKVDLRVSTLPTPTIESVVFRVLDSSQGISTFSELGFAPHIEKKILSSLYRHNGIVLVTGPTGSGKTTTLYSMLAELNTSERKLVTLEDPIEYHLDGISQSQVDETSDYTFDSGFKALLRQDPDVILVGEIRTLQTARLAFEAALTGHTVLSSLHANSAVGAISRLRNLGVQDVNTAPTISAIFAQRLVRRVCKKCCKQASSPGSSRIDSAIERLKKVLPGQKTPNDFSIAQGCESCSFTGYSGQIAISETFMVDDTLREMILNGIFETEILEYLHKNTDYLSLWEDGVLKVLEGVTTLDEIERVVGTI